MQSWWTDFRDSNPCADAVYQLLASMEDHVTHDHIALRTFATESVGIDTFMAPMVAAGYIDTAEYIFPKTHVYARHYEHPDAEWPNVFISQLELRAFSNTFQTTLGGLLRRISRDRVGRWDFFTTARPWEISFAAYETLKQESEYAAWVSAFGFRPTHFAVRTNSFLRYRELATLNTLLKERGFELNTTGGEIQGSPHVYLEQSSLKAAQTQVTFSDGIYSIPGTYYEFAKRYAMPDGTLFNGFITESAVNLFHSTHSPSRSLLTAEASVE